LLNLPFERPGIDPSGTQAQPVSGRFRIGQQATMSNPYKVSVVVPFAKIKDEDASLNNGALADSGHFACH